MDACPPPCGDWILMAATLVAIQLSKGLTVDEMALMSAFFGVLGSDLGFLAITRAEKDDEPDSNKGCRTQENRLD